MIKLHFPYAILLFALFSFACGGDSSETVIQPPVTESPAVVIIETKPQVISTRYLSRHFIEFIFDKPITSDL